MEKVRPIKRKWRDLLINTNVIGKEPEISRNISRHFETKTRMKKKQDGRINKYRIKKKRNNEKERTQ